MTFFFQLLIDSLGVRRQEFEFHSSLGPLSLAMFPKENEKQNKTKQPKYRKKKSCNGSCNVPQYVSQYNPLSTQMLIAISHWSDSRLLTSDTSLILAPHQDSCCCPCCGDCRTGPVTYTNRSQMMTVWWANSKPWICSWVLAGQPALPALYAPL